MSRSRPSYHDPLFALEFHREHLREFKLFDNGDAEPLAKGALLQDTALIVRLKRKGLKHAITQLNKSAFKGNIPGLTVSCEDDSKGHYRVTYKFDDAIPDLLSDDPLYCKEEF